MIDWTQMRVQHDANGQPISGEIVFSHVDTAGVVRHFAVERIENWLRTRPDLPIIEFPIDYQFALYCRHHRGIEAHRLMRITPQDVAAYPVVLAHMPGVGTDVSGGHLMIDGHHRYCWAAAMGWKTLRGYVLSEEIVEQYMVYIPEEFSRLKGEELRNQHERPIDSRIK